MGILLAVTPALCHPTLSETTKQKIPRKRSPCPGAALLERGKWERHSKRKATGRGEESKSCEAALKEAGDIWFRSKEGGEKKGEMCKIQYPYG